MGNYNKVRERYKDKRAAPKHAILRTVTSGGKLFLAVCIDIATFIAVFPLLFWQLERGGPVVSGWLFVPIAVQLILILFFGGLTIGNLIVGLRYVHQHTYKLFRGPDMIAYAVESFWDRFKYNDLYESISFLADPHFQSPAMKIHGVLIVDYKQYKMFLKDYLVNGQIPYEKTEPTDSPILEYNGGSIFKDE